MRLTIEDEAYDLGLTTLIGRSQDCNIVIDSPAISLRHATITKEQGSWWISDSSRNGTFVNGERVDPGTPRRLKFGDIIQFNGKAQAIVSAKVNHEETQPGHYQVMQEITKNWNRLHIIEQAVDGLKQLLDEILRRQKKDDEFRESTTKEFEAMRRKNRQNSTLMRGLNKIFLVAFGLSGGFVLAIAGFYIAEEIEKAGSFPKGITQAFGDHLVESVLGGALFTALGTLYKFVDNNLKDREEDKEN